LALCLGHVAATPWIDAAVIGVDTAGQLREMARGESNAALPPATEAELGRIAAMAPPRLLNPALW
jgi:aryl-alcohol dehydrogenase-like predicted oxidoreductase